MSAASDAREAEVARRIVALHGYGDSQLASKLASCQEARLEHRQAVRQGRRVPYPPRCRSVACTGCHGALERGWQDKVRARWKDVSTDAEHVSLATWPLALCGSLDVDVEPLIQQVRAKLRNRRRSAWKDFTMDAVVEIDAMFHRDMDQLFPGRAKALAGLPVIGRAGGWSWIPCVHAVISHPGVSRAGLAAQLGELWPGEGRVHVQPLWSERDARDNAAGVVGYALKHRQVTSLRHGDIPWSDEIKAAYWSWLAGSRRGVEPLRIRFRPIRRLQISSLAGAENLAATARDLSERSSCPYTTVRDASPPVARDASSSVERHGADVVLEALSVVFTDCHGTRQVLGCATTAHPSLFNELVARD